MDYHLGYQQLAKLAKIRFPVLFGWSSGTNDHGAPASFRRHASPMVFCKHLWGMGFCAGFLTFPVVKTCVGHGVSFLCRDKHSGVGPPSVSLQGRKGWWSKELRRPGRD